MHALSSSFDPLLRPRRPGAAVFPFLAFLLLLLAGCAGEPAPPQAGGPIPLQVYNHTNSTREVHFEVREPDTGSVLLSYDQRVAPQRTVQVDTGLLGHGDYLLVAKAGIVTREARVDFERSSLFFRFIVEDQLIAFQSG
jgi:hypothetical protein